MTPDRDEALISAYAILSLLHYRGLVDSERNREEHGAEHDRTVRPRRRTPGDGGPMIVDPGLESSLRRVDSDVHRPGPIRASVPTDTYRVGETVLVQWQGKSRAARIQAIHVEAQPDDTVVITYTLAPAGSRGRHSGLDRSGPMTSYPDPYSPYLVSYPDPYPNPRAHPV